MKRALLTLAYWVYGLRWRIFHPITLGVRVMLVSNGGVLMVRHSYQQAWNFPGGGVKRGETLAEAAAREAHEEAGARFLEPPVLLGVFASFQEGKNDHIALFVCERFTLEPPTDRWEIEARAVFPVAGLPGRPGGRLQRCAADYLAGRRGLVERW